MFEYTEQSKYLAYCGDACKKQARRRQFRNHMRMQRAAIRQERLGTMDEPKIIVIEGKERIKQTVELEKKC